MARSTPRAGSVFPRRIFDVWLADRSGTATGWITDGDQCDAGSLALEAHLTALGYVESYRRLSGVGSVEINAAVAAEQQECALLMHANGNISHSPPPEWNCYTEAGAAAAGSSLSACGFFSAASTVDAYVQETISGLPHRRNVLSVGRAGVLFGHAGSGGWLRDGGSYAALGTDPEYVYQPNPGFAPLQVFSSRWSVQPGTGGSATFTAQIFRESDNEELPADQLSSGSSLSSWNLDGWSVEPDETYRVVLTGDVGTREYTTTPMVSSRQVASLVLDCGARCTAPDGVLLGLPGARGEMWRRDTRVLRQVPGTTSRPVSRSRLHRGGRHAVDRERQPAQLSGQLWLQRRLLVDENVCVPSHTRHVCVMAQLSEVRADPRRDPEVPRGWRRLVGRAHLGERGQRYDDVHRGLQVCPARRKQEVIQPPVEARPTMEMSGQPLAPRVVGAQTILGRLRGPALLGGGPSQPVAAGGREANPQMVSEGLTHQLGPQAVVHEVIFLHGRREGLPQMGEPQDFFSGHLAMGRGRSGQRIEELRRRHPIVGELNQIRVCYQAVPELSRDLCGGVATVAVGITEEGDDGHGTSLYPRGGRGIDSRRRHPPFLGRKQRLASLFHCDGRWRLGPSRILPLMGRQIPGQPRSNNCYCQ